MSYGTITSSGSIDTSCSFSNDFTVSKISGTTGQYLITFLEWMGSKPALTITPINSTPNNGYSAVYSIGLPDTYGRYSATVVTYNGTNKANESFAFESRSGHVLTFNSPSPTNLTLTPSVISFGSPSTQILVLSATITLKINGTSQSFTTHLDKGTSLLGVGTSMVLALSATSVSDNNRNTWDLTGYTYSGGTATTGTAWAGSSTTLSIGSGGPVTTPELFVIKGTPHSGNTNKSTLSTDPLVRLTSVAPAGLAM